MKLFSGRDKAEMNRESEGWGGNSGREGKIGTKPSDGGVSGRRKCFFWW